MLHKEMLISGSESSYPKICWMPYNIVFKQNALRIANMWLIDIGLYDVQKHSTYSWVYCDFADAPDTWTMADEITAQGYNANRVANPSGYLTLCIKFLVPVQMTSGFTPSLFLSFDKSDFTKYTSYSDAMWEAKGLDIQNALTHYDSFLNEEDIWVTSATNNTRIARAPVTGWYEGEKSRQYLSGVNTDTFSDDDNLSGWFSGYRYVTKKDFPICISQVDSLNGIALENSDDFDDMSYFHELITIEDRSKYWATLDSTNTYYYVNPDLVTIESLGKNLYSLTADELESVILSPQTITTGSGEKVQDLVDVPIAKLGVVLY